MHLPPLLAGAAGVLLLAGHATAVTEVSLVELLEMNAVSITATALGGHTGESIRVSVRNRTAAPLRTRIPIGWRFTSVDPGVQDLLVVQEELLAIGVGGTKTVTCRAFCCKASASVPPTGNAYRSGRQADAKLTQLARAIAAGSYADHTVQSAVWVLSDRRSIAGMGAAEDNASDTLRHVVSRLSGQPVPRYSLRYAHDPQQACSGRPERISRTMRITTAVTVAFTAVVLDAQGRTVRELYRHHPLEPGTHTLELDVDVSQLPPGLYAIHTYNALTPGVHRFPFEL
jgi:hypothetical protein